MKTTTAARKTITTEYRNAKAALENALGCAHQIGLDAHLVVCSGSNGPFVPALSVKEFYVARGANVAPCAIKTMAYARAARAWEAYAAL